MLRRVDALSLRSIPGKSSLKTLRGRAYLARRARTHTTSLPEVHQRQQGRVTGSASMLSELMMLPTAYFCLVMRRRQTSAAQQYTGHFTRTPTIGRSIISCLIHRHEVRPWTLSVKHARTCCRDGVRGELRREGILSGCTRRLRVGASYRQRGCWDFSDFGTAAMGVSLDSHSHEPPKNRRPWTTPSTSRYAVAWKRCAGSS